MDEFDTIVMSEVAAVNKGFESGVKHGEIIGEKEGHSIGFARGKETGQELGAIFGVCNVFKILNNQNNFNQSNDVKSRRYEELLNKTTELIEDFIKDPNPTDPNIDERLSRIRSNFKRICSMSKVNCSYLNDPQSLSF